MVLGCHARAAPRGSGGGGTAEMEWSPLSRCLSGKAQSESISRLQEPEHPDRDGDRDERDRTGPPGAHLGEGRPPAAGGILLNHSEATGLKVRTSVNGGRGSGSGVLLNHSETKALKVRT